MFSSSRVGAGVFVDGEGLAVRGFVVFMGEGLGVPGFCFLFSGLSFSSLTVAGHGLDLAAVALGCPFLLTFARSSGLASQGNVANAV